MSSGGNKTSTSPPPSGSPPPSKNSSPPPSSSPSPPGNDKSPPPPPSNNSDNNSSGSNNSPPPSGNNGSNNSPPSSGNNGSNNSPPSSGNNGGNNSPPSSGNNGSNNSSPASGNNNNNDSPPPPSQNNSPSPPNDNSNNGNNNNGNNNNDNNNNNDKSSPTPPSSNDNSSPSPPSSFAPSPPSRGSSDRSPAPPKQLTPSKSSSNDNGPSSDSGFDSKKITAVASVAAAAGLLILVLVAFVVVCTRKRKKKQHHMYYGEPAKGGGYYRGSNVYQDPGINLSQLHSGQHGYQPQPPPPPPMMSSGDMSSGFSGPHGPPMPPPHPNVSLGFNQSSFSYEELAAATSGFAQANLLGQGGFGYVFKGVLPNGKEVAVKTLKAGSGQGDREFRAEVEIISRVHHRHLVSLVGYCIAQGQKMLVYEFVPNDTLEHHLYAKSVTPLDWPTRLRIAVGSAKGLAYLHEDCHPRIIHRDIKASNILIDHTFEAKVADFGLAKLSDNNYTHVSTRVMGTFGYLAPEYAASGKLTEKSDVFSFGVMLLELITGRRPVDTTGEMEDSLVDWARPLCLRGMEDGNFEELVDPRLEGNFDPHEMARMVACAGASIRHSARRRPKMSQIVRALEGDVSLEDLNEGVKPGQSGQYGSRSASSDYDASSYSDDMKKFRKMALSSQDFSEEYGNTGELSASSNGSNLPKNGSRKLNL